MKHLDLLDIKKRNSTHNSIVTPHRYALTYTHIYIPLNY